MKTKTSKPYQITAIASSDKYQIKNYEGEKLAILMKLVS
jgi:hypothetical protein